MPADDARGDTTPEAQRAKPQERKSFSDLINEFAGLVITYVKQETLDPIKALRRFLVYGFAAAVMISIGWVVLSIAVTRLLQAEAHNHLGGSLSWVSYIGGMITAALGVVWVLSRISKEQK